MMEHVFVLETLVQSPFSMGSKLLTALLRGERTSQITKLKLNNHEHFGSLGGYSAHEIEKFLNFLNQQGLLTRVREQGRFLVWSVTQAGQEALTDRTKSYSVEDADVPILETHRPELISAPITEQDKELFTSLGFFLDRFTDEQKKAIICKDKAQLCVAGAGSGKTSVLTHKIVYLIKFAGVDPKDILAITFTRKARQEMQERLGSLLDQNIRVETFNSFGETELQRKGEYIYDAPKQMIDNRAFLQLVTQGLRSIGYQVDQFLQQYFEASEKRGKEPRQLLFSFLYDFRTLLDNYITQDGVKDVNTDTLSLAEKNTTSTLLKLLDYVATQLHEQNLRTYADQLIDCCKLYEEAPTQKPSYKWILVDEFQDVNEQQLKLITLLNPEYLFVVGDPRQSIYAWRGSNPELIYDVLEKGITNKHKEVTTLVLTRNFRSTTKVVRLANALLSDHAHYSSMEANSENAGVISLVPCASEDEECQQVVSQIKVSQTPRHDIFVLSRTNKGLEKIAKHLDRAGISYVKRTDDARNVIPGPDDVLLATVHAIKGLEAQEVYVVGVNAHSYPATAKDHRYVELLAQKNSYNQYEEERRILYVACTRAKHTLHISYYGPRSPFITREVLDLFKAPRKQRIINTDKLASQRSNLRKWRFAEAKERGLPPYMIFSDKVMEQLLNMQPQSVEELYAVSGLGKSKIETFGYGILDALYFK